MLSTKALHNFCRLLQQQAPKNVMTHQLQLHRKPIRLQKRTTKKKKFLDPSQFQLTKRLKSNLEFRGINDKKYNHPNMLQLSIVRLNLT